MVTGTRTSTVPRTVNLPDLPGIRINNRRSPIHSLRLTSPHRGDRRPGKPSRSRAGDAALEVIRAGAQARQGVSGTGRREAAVATAATGGLGAAFDVVGRARAGVADVLAAAGGAGRGGDADAWGAAGAGAGSVDDGAFSEGVDGLVVCEGCTLIQGVELGRGITLGEDVAVDGGRRA